jgi:hypothetical protein
MGGKKTKTCKFEPRTGSTKDGSMQSQKRVNETKERFDRKAYWKAKPCGFQCCSSSPPKPSEGHTQCRSVTQMRMRHGMSVILPRFQVENGRNTKRRGGGGGGKKGFRKNTFYRFLRFFPTSTFLSCFFDFKDSIVLHVRSIIRRYGFVRWTNGASRVFTLFELVELKWDCRLPRVLLEQVKMNVKLLALKVHKWGCCENLHHLKETQF